MIRSAFFFLMVMLSSNALAAESVQFSERDLGAIITIMRPELNSIELDGRKVIFKPAPSIHYLGIEESETPLDMTVIADIVDLEFNHLRAKTPEIRFRDGSLEVSVPVENRTRAVQSALGSISFSDVIIRAKLGWNTRTDGSQELVLKGTVFEGNLKGTGILRSKFILDQTRKLCLILMNQALKKTLASEQIQQSIGTGLVEYAKFYTGAKVRELDPGTIEFYDNGIRYQVVQ
jgi:hypothetical protein